MDPMEEDNINVQNIEQMLEDVASGKGPYIDSEEIVDACEYLYNCQRFDDVDIMTSYGMSLHPDSADIQIIRTKMLIDTDRMKEAVLSIDTLQQTQSENPDFNIICGWFNLKQHKVRVALNYFNKAVELDNDELGLDFEIGLNLNQFGYHKEAIKFLKHFQKSHPDDPECMFETAYALEKVGQREKSALLYEELLDKKPFYETAWYNLGILYNNVDEYDKALMAYDTAVTINPEYADPYFNMGNTYVTLARYEEAINCYTDYAVLCDPDHLYPVYQNIGECWWEMGNMELARRFYHKALEMQPDRVDIMYGYALCCIETDMNTTAIEWLSKAIEMEPDNSDLNFAKAQAYYSTSQKSKALDELMEGLKKDPEVILAWHEALKLYVDQNGDDSAFTFIEKNGKKYGTKQAFRFIQAYVIYKFGQSKETVIKILDKIAQKDNQTIYNAAEDEDLRSMLKDEDIASMLLQHNIIITDPTL